VEVGGTVDVGLPGGDRRSYAVGVACQDCGDPDTNASLGGVEVCDSCFDRRISAETGFPRLPAPPPPIVLTGPDGRDHRLRFRIWRAPTGIEVQLGETRVPVGEGYEFAVLGDHDAEVEALLSKVRSRAEEEIGRSYLERASHRSGWTLRDDEVAGRLVWSDEVDNGKPYDVVIDGRVLSWEEFGTTLDSYEGWGFRLVIEDRVEDARSNAEVIEMRRPPDRPRGD
jgi:hypothetical protein